MIRKLSTLILALLLIGGAVYAWIAEQPVLRTPAADWQQTITSPDFSAETFMVPVDGAEIEAMILLPNDRPAPVAAVIFAGGSGDGLFQDYAPGFLKSYLQDVFLPRGIAVVYMNKRGMGASTGNWMNNTIEGRAADLRAVAAAVRARPEIDAAGVGYAGHSQGGWVVVRAAADDPATLFVLNFMGPLRSTIAQFDFMWHEIYRCNGLEGAALDRAFARKQWITRFGMRVGHVLPVGMLEFDAKFFTYDNADLLDRVHAPMLSVYGSSDILVNGPANERFLEDSFPKGVPAHLQAVTIDGINHGGLHQVGICDVSPTFGPQSVSPKLQSVVANWLTEIGS
jgi:pimeloyl-ACP methyl ester carboxylesterase